MSHPCCICGRSGHYGVGEQGAGNYCHVHRKALPVADDTVRKAKKMMTRLGFSLAEAARAVGAEKHDLDLAMWKAFGKNPTIRARREAVSA